MIVRNEAHNLPICLEGIRDLVDEMVIVDTGSTDATREVARDLGARVFEFPWQDSFAVARNESIRHARGAWIFWLDADDRVDAANRLVLRDLFARLGNENAAWLMNCRCPPEEEGGSAVLVEHARLFRNLPSARWEYRVHEQILLSVRRSGGHVHRSPAIIEHTGYLDPTLRRDKLLRNLRLLDRDVADFPDAAFPLFNLGWTLLQLGRAAESADALERCRRVVPAGMTIVPKLFALLIHAYRGLQRPDEALRRCEEGRRHAPEDAELLFLEGVLRWEAKDTTSAERCWLAVLSVPAGPNWNGHDVGLQAVKTRLNLAALYEETGQPRQAETQWRAVIETDPGVAAAWSGLAASLEQQDRGGDLLGLMEALRDAIERHPRSADLRWVVAEWLHRRGASAGEQEAALREVLRVRPAHSRARQALAALRG